MSKPLCELKKTLKQDFESFTDLVIGATHVCEKCGRCANGKKLVCRPIKLKRRQIAAS